ncbi:hypothetical protein AK36_5091 [Burkholderia vietnamiensis LMG 10929]|nr:hypothetical protein AK36_5091 [Burkholderia vietnamiensis LMG 10929]
MSRAGLRMVSPGSAGAAATGESADRRQGGRRRLRVGVDARGRQIAPFSAPTASGPHPLPGAGQSAAGPNLASPVLRRRARAVGGVKQAARLAGLVDD